MNLTTFRIAALFFLLSTSVFAADDFELNVDRPYYMHHIDHDNGVIHECNTNLAVTKYIPFIGADGKEYTKSIISIQSFGNCKTTRVQRPPVEPTDPDKPDCDRDGTNHGPVECK